MIKMVRIMKIFKLIINLLLVVILLTGIGCITMLVIGIQPYVVVSGSMEPEIPTGSLCFVDKRVTFNQVSTGMIIAFYDNSGTMITHRVSRMNKNGVITKGDANKVEDPGYVTASNYVGRNVHHIEKVGTFIEKVRSGSGKIIVIVSVIIILVLGVVVNSSGKSQVDDKVLKY